MKSSLGSATSFVVAGARKCNILIETSVRTTKAMLRSLSALGFRLQNAFSLFSIILVLLWLSTCCVANDYSTTQPFCAIDSAK